VQAGQWVDLEDGVQVWFEPGGTYQTGDYWLVPARTATGDVLWPTEPDADGTPVPQPLPPRGVEHHYAPLGRISTDGDGIVTCVADCRCVIAPLCGEPEESPTPSQDPPTIQGVVANPPRTNACPATAPVQFTATVQGTAPLTYAWNFGDGSTSSDVQPSHKYTNAGTFNAVLTVSNAAGTAEASAQVAVAPCSPNQLGTAAEVTRAPTTTTRRAATDTATATATATTDPLLTNSGLGPSRAATLREAGYTTPADVAKLSAEGLQRLLKVSAATAEEILKSAREAAERG
jgi:predicted flap endonuclease-1-like 5' DNA nuclease